MKKLAVLAMLACAGASFAWVQPWTPNLSSFESRVSTCANPTPPTAGGRIAADDFSHSATTVYTTINWWGTLTTTAQAQRPYYLAIYRDVDCLPAWTTIVWRACVVPTVQTVGTDCQGRLVYKFFTNHAPFTLPAGRYWLQVSEIDQNSVQPGVVDFRWSAHNPIVQCSALQRDAVGTIFRPLIEACTQQRVDLAFEVL